MATATDPPTVSVVVTAALSILGVRTAESAITAAEGVDGLFTLNDMMAEWSLDGIDVGYEALDETTDIINVLPGAVAAIKPNLAIYMAPEYSRTVSPALAARAKSAKRALRSSIRLKKTTYPDTLPIGSGNEDNNFVADGDVGGTSISHRFYPSNVEGQCN